MNSPWKQRHRQAGFLWLAGFLLWLPFEDIEVVAPIILAVWLIVWAALLLARKLKDGRKLWPHAILGLLGGVSTPVLATILMVFKTGIHAHGFSEYGTKQFLFVISTIPISLFLGLVFGMIFLRRFAHLEKVGGDSS